MATVRVSGPNPEKISIRSIPGLTAEDIDELRHLGIGSLKDLLQALERHNGDLAQLSAGVVVIEKAQSDRIGDLALAYAEAHFAEHSGVKAILKKLQVGTPVGVTYSHESSQPTPAATGTFQRFWNGLTGRPENA